MKDAWRNRPHDITQAVQWDAVMTSSESSEDALMKDGAPHARRSKKKGVVKKDADSELELFHIEPLRHQAGDTDVTPPSKESSVSEGTTSATRSSGTSFPTSDTTQRDSSSNPTSGAFPSSTDPSSLTRSSSSQPQQPPPQPGSFVLVTPDGRASTAAAAGKLLEAEYHHHTPAELELMRMKAKAAELKELQHVRLREGWRPGISITIGADRRKHRMKTIRPFYEDAAQDDDSSEAEKRKKREKDTLGGADEHTPATDRRAKRIGARAHAGRRGWDLTKEDRLMRLILQQDTKLGVARIKEREKQIERLFFELLELNEMAELEDAQQKLRAHARPTFDERTGLRLPSAIQRIYHASITAINRSLAGLPPSSLELSVAQHSVSAISQTPLAFTSLLLNPVTKQKPKKFFVFGTCPFELLPVIQPGKDIMDGHVCAVSGLFWGNGHLAIVSANGIVALYKETAATRTLRSLDDIHLHPNQLI
jgi:hypothetical protein